MKKICLVAGGGSLPLEFIRAVRDKKGTRLVVFAIQGMADPCIEQEADKVYWVNIGHYKKYLFLLLKERVRGIVLLGKIEKNMVYAEGAYDRKGASILGSMSDKKDSTIFKTITGLLRKLRIEVLDPTEYLSHLLPRKGVLSRKCPEPETEEDINFGYDLAKSMAGMDVGQTVVVKNKSIVAIEAMEGTDSTIERACTLAGEGCVMVKVSRPAQDMRWDVPTIGPSTIATLVKGGFRAVAIEAGSMFLVEKEKTLGMANAAGLVVKAM